MCNLSKGAIEEGFNDGYARGNSEGYARGRSEEHERSRSESLRTVASLVRDGLVALEEAARRFGFSEQELRAAL